MRIAVQQTIKHWGYIFPYVHVPKNESEYHKQLNILEDLMELSHQKKDERITTLIKEIAKNLEIYEMRKHKAKPVSSIEMLKFLMEEHELSQSDLPEIGSQSLVSKILHEERRLTVEHIKLLAKRFGVSPAVFIADENI